MSEPPDHEARITALEIQVRVLSERMRNTQQSASEARVLAGGADRDVAEIRAEMRQHHEHNIRAHNATDADLADPRKQGHSEFTELRAQMDGIAAGQQRIVDMLTELISRDERPKQ